MSIEMGTLGGGSRCQPDPAALGGKGALLGAGFLWQVVLAVGLGKRFLLGVQFGNGAPPCFYEPQPAGKALGCLAIFYSGGRGLT